MTSSPATASSSSVSLHQKVVDELLSTEQAYVADLQLVVELFLQPIREDPGIIGGKGNLPKLTEIFSNWEALLGLNQKVTKG